MMVAGIFTPANYATPFSSILKSEQQSHNRSPKFAVTIQFIMEEKT